MKIKEILEIESKNNWENLSEHTKEQILYKINYKIIELLDKQPEIDLPPFIQKLANLLSDENQKQLVSLLNFLISKDKINYPIEDFEKTKNELLEQEPKLVKVEPELKKEIKEESKEKIQEIKEVTNLETKTIEVDKNEKSSTEVNKIEVIEKSKEDIVEVKIPEVEKDEYTIDELSGTGLGIVLGTSTKMDVLSIMKNYSTKFANTNTLNIGKQVTYDDVSVIVLFNEQKIVKALTFGKDYKGTTLRGLKAGDKIERAIELYGTPQYKTPYSCEWKELTVFCDVPNVISSIKLQLEDFEKIKKNLLNQENSTKSTEESKVHEEVKETDKAEIVIEEPINTESKVEEIKVEEPKIPEVERTEYTIDEVEGIALGIALGKSNKMDVLSIMKNYSTKFANTNTLNIGKQVTYDDASIIVLFNEQKLVKGLTFGKDYKGTTLRGLKVGDKIERAIELYGNPQYKNPYSCEWKELTVFCDVPNVISSIRLQL